MPIALWLYLIDQFYHRHDQVVASSARAESRLSMVGKTRWAIKTRMLQRKEIKIADRTMKMLLKSLHFTSKLASSAPEDSSAIVGTVITSSTASVA